MCNCATTRISGLVVAKRSSHRGKPSLNPRRSTFCLSCCHETSDSKATGGGRGHKVIYRWYWMVLLEWAECYEIEGKRTMLSDCIYFPCYYYFYFYLSVFRLCLFDVSSLNVEYLQKCLVMMTAFGRCRADGRGASQSHNHLRSCKVWGKIGEG